MATETDCSQQESLEMADDLLEDLSGKWREKISNVINVLTRQQCYWPDYDMPSPDFGAVYNDVLDEDEDPALPCDPEITENVQKTSAGTSSPLLLKCR